MNSLNETQNVSDEMIDETPEEELSGVEQVQETAAEVVDAAADAITEVQEASSDAVEAAAETVTETVEKVQETTSDIAEAAANAAAEAVEEAQEAASEAEEDAEEVVKEAEEAGEEAASEVEETASETVEEVQSATSEVAEAAAAAAAAAIAAVTQKQEPAKPQPASAPAITETEFDDDVVEEALSEQADEVENELKRGMILKGTITQVSPTEIRVEVDEAIEGVISGREIERMDRETLEGLEEGEKTLVYVLSTSGHDGKPVFSIQRAMEEQDWFVAEQYYKDDLTYESKVAGYNKDGLIIRFGKVRGFVPASQISRNRRRRSSGKTPEERWGDMVGEAMMVKVVEVDRHRNRLILSERAASREWRAKKKERLVEELEVGEIREGKVMSLADFGAFVDLGGADGLVHLTELSWQHVNHPKEVLKVGEKVRVQVINIDADRNRIGLSIKRLQDDPWYEIVGQYQVDQLVQGAITKLTKFGAFARLVDSPEIEGLIHISELADHRIDHPRDVVAKGDILTLRIIKIDEDARRVGLSLRRVDHARYADVDWRMLEDDN